MTLPWELLSGYTTAPKCLKKDPLYSPARSPI